MSFFERDRFDHAPSRQGVWLAHLPETYDPLCGRERKALEVGEGLVEALARHLLVSRASRNDGLDRWPTTARQLAQDHYGVWPIALQ